MNTFQNDLQENLQTLKKRLPSEDILTFLFQTKDGVDCALVYADGMVNKELLGGLVARPFSASELQEKLKKGGGKVALSEQTVQKTALFPEWKTPQK